jgi:hypothetical protein
MTRVEWLLLIAFFLIGTYLCMIFITARMMV